MWNRPGVGMTSSPIVAQLGPDVAVQVCTLSLTTATSEGNLTVDSSRARRRRYSIDRSAAVLCSTSRNNTGGSGIRFIFGDSQRNRGYDRHRCGAFGVPCERVDVWFGDDLGESPGGAIPVVNRLKSFSRRYRNHHRNTDGRNGGEHSDGGGLIFCPRAPRIRGKMKDCERVAEYVKSLPKGFSNREREFLGAGSQRFVSGGRSY